MGHSRAVMPFVMGDEAVHERVTLDDARILLNSPPDARAVSVPSVAAHVQVYDRAELGSPHLPFERWTPAVPLDIGYSVLGVLDVETLGWLRNRNRDGDGNCEHDERTFLIMFFMTWNPSTPTPMWGEPQPHLRRVWARHFFLDVFIIPC